MKLSKEVKESPDPTPDRERVCGAEWMCPSGERSGEMCSIVTAEMKIGEESFTTTVP